MRNWGPKEGTRGRRRGRREGAGLGESKPGWVVPEEWERGAKVKCSEPARPGGGGVGRGRGPPGMAGEPGMGFLEEFTLKRFHSSGTHLRLREPELSPPSAFSSALSPLRGVCTLLSPLPDGSPELGCGTEHRELS